MFPLIPRITKTGMSSWRRCARKSRVDCRESLSLFLDQPRAKHNAVAVIVQFERENEHIPDPAIAFRRQVGNAAKAAVDISLSGVGDSENDLFPLAAQFGKLFK